MFLLQSCGLAKDTLIMYFMLFQVFFSQCHRSKSIEKYGTFETLIYGKCAKKEEILRQICQMSNVAPQCLFIGSD